MLRPNITKFTLSYGEYSLECRVPTSVRSAMLEAGEDVQLLLDEAVFSTLLTADEAVHSFGYLYIRLFELKCSAAVYLNGIEAGRTEGTRPRVSHPIKELVKEGKNLLEIKFKKGEDASLAGIFAPISVLRFNSASIERVSVAQRRGDGRVYLDIDLDLIGDREKARVVATLTSAAGRVYFGGLTRGSGCICVDDPLYWWPRGMGVPNLYRLSVCVYGEEEIEDSLDMRIGLRSVERGEGMIVTVNGNLHILPMGGVYYPDQPSLTDGDLRMEKIVEYAAMAGYNSILLPADAVRPSERLYDLCDVYGLMLVEEIDSLDPDRIECLRHVAHHPCLCVVDLIGEAVYGEDKLRAICRGSALFTLGERASYPSCPSLSSDNTIAEQLLPEERNLFSYEVEAVSSPESLRSMIWAASERYPYAMDMSDLTYVSGLAAGCRINRAVKDARLKDGYPERAIFDCLYDSHRLVSCSALDRSVRWKPLHYTTMRSFSPVALYAENRDGRVYFSLSNHRPVDLIGSVEYRLADADNNTIATGSQPIEVGAFGHANLFNRDFAQQIKGMEREYYLEYYCKEGISRHSRGTLLFVPEKHFKFREAAIKIQLTGSDRKYSLTLSANKFVKDLEISLPGVDAIFSENYIDITESAPVKIDITLTDAPDNSYRLGKLLKLRSIYDITN